MPDLPLADRPDVVLAGAPPEAEKSLTAALERPADERREAIGRVVADHPTFLLGWARLAQHGRDPIERYAFARVGYHRGLDAIRKHGWGGNGYVRWQHQTNRGFLRCLVGLRDAAREIGETDEVDRIDEFLHQLDPEWSDDRVD